MEQIFSLINTLGEWLFRHSLQSVKLGSKKSETTLTVDVKFQHNFTCEA